MLLDIPQNQLPVFSKSIFCKAKAVVCETSNSRFPRLSRILIVDSHPDTCDLFALVLEEIGAEVITASSCEEALIYIQDQPPNVLISEIALPGENGLTLVRKARLMAQTDQPILALAVTSYTENEDQLEIYSAGFHRYLSKPVDIYELIDVVTDMIAQSQKNQPL